VVSRPLLLATSSDRFLLTREGEIIPPTPVPMSDIILRLLAEV
jgi:hypothetical protein